MSIKVTIIREDFKNAPRGYFGQSCPLVQALRRQGEYVRHITNSNVYTGNDLGGVNYKIPFSDIWGGDYADFSEKRINKLSRLAKISILKYFVPSVTFELQEL